MASGHLWLRNISSTSRSESTVSLVPNNYTTKYDYGAIVYIHFSSLCVLHTQFDKVTTFRPRFVICRSPSVQSDNNSISEVFRVDCSIQKTGYSSCNLCEAMFIVQAFML